MMGVEPTIYCSEGNRLSHLATWADVQYQLLTTIDKEYLLKIYSTLSLYIHEN